MKTLSYLLIFSILVGFTSCNKESNGRVIVRMTDSPGDYQEVNVDIVDVEIHRLSGEQSTGWESLSANSGIYNLLDLSGGMETILADTEITSGEISQIRLVLGTNNTVKVDGNVMELATPSSQQSGLKVIINETLLEGVTYSILLDFDAAKSVVINGNSGNILKPVIRAILDGRDGAVSGTVVPAAENVAVYAMIGEDTLGSSYSTENNENWFIGGLEAGTYTIVLDPGELSTYNFSSIPSVSVALGQVNDTGETVLELK